MTERRTALGSRNPLVIGLGVLVALIAGLLTTATPAQAAYSILFSPSGGTVGTSIALTSTVSSGASGVGIGTVTYYAAGQSVATAKVDAIGSVAAATWTPTAAGSVTMNATYVSGDGTQTATSGPVTVTIAKAPTTTELTMPTTAKTGATVAITATVKAGAYVPTGSVTFLLPSNVVLTAANVDAKGVATISVKMPDSASTYELSARYIPDANTTESTSKAGTTLVTASGSNTALSLSTTTLAIGVPVTLTADITPASSSGNVTFSAGSTVLGSSVVASGKATLTWKPATAGAVTLTASFIPKGETKPTGSDSAKITVTGSLPADTITLGASGQPAWAPGSGYPLRYKSQVTVAATAKSGGPVALAIAGPCTLTGSTLTAIAATGTCTLTAKSPGGSLLASATQNYTIALARGKQTATLSPPVPPTLRRGTYYRLSSAGTLTNAGYPVTWRVSFGTARCKVLKQADGSYQLRAKKLGRCTVRAYVAPVAGQWLKYSKYYKYRVQR